MGTSGINFSGLASGIDTESIIQKLLTIEKQPAQQLQKQQKSLLDKSAAYKTVSAQLLAFQTAGIALNRLRSFEIVKADSSLKDNVTVTANAGAQIGQHDLVVNTLAATQKIGTKTFTSQTDPLGYNGQIVVNGKTLQVRDTDSLQSLASSINAAQTGVTASIISPDSTTFILTLGSNNSGAQGKISLADSGSGTFLSSTLGIFGSGSSLHHAISTTGAASNNFSDSATSVGTLLGLTSPPSGSVQIAGQSVSIDLSVDSLSGVASKINAAGISGVSANVRSVTDPITQATVQRLEISGTQSFTDSNNVLSNLGIVQQNYDTGRELTQGTDAAFTIDGISGTRASNTVTDLVAGVTINLLKDGGAKSTINITSDTDTIKSQVNEYVGAYNKLVDTVQGFSQYDGSTGKTGALFADVTTQNVLDSLTSGITGQVSGLSSSFSLISQAGVTLDQTGHLNVDDSVLSKVLTTNLKDVARIFRSDGVASSSLVHFVSATGNTKPSGATGYALNITQAAEQASTTAGTAQSQTLGQDETLTFGGSLLGAGTAVPFENGKSITIRAGSSLTDVVSAINGDASVGKFLSASVDSNGKLKISSRQYGSSSQFSVISNFADTGTGNTTGIGNSAIVVSGKDVSGTINGETARGTGQFLLGIQSGGKANGLQLQVTAATSGSLGTVTYTSGVAQFVVTSAVADTDATNGILTQATNSIQASLDGIQKDAAALDERVKAKEDALRRQFSAMEGAISKIKASSAGIASLASIPTYSSSSK